MGYSKQSENRSKVWTHGDMRATCGQPRALDSAKGRIDRQCTCTVVPGEETDRRIEELRDRPSGGLRAEARAVRIVVHERDLLLRLVCHIKIPLLTHAVAVST